MGPFSHGAVLGTLDGSTHPPFILSLVGGVGQMKTRFPRLPRKLVSTCEFVSVNWIHSAGDLEDKNEVGLIFLRDSAVVSNKQGGGSMTLSCSSVPVSISTSCT